MTSYDDNNLILMKVFLNGFQILTMNNISRGVNKIPAAKFCEVKRT